MAFVLGVTGSIGSGKTTVTAFMREGGAAVINADELARQAVQPGRPALAAIVREFGPQMLDESGQLRRKALAERVFDDRAATRRLGELIHPEVVAQTRRLLEELKDDHPVIVVDVPLLFEAGMQGLMDKVLVVTITENQRFSRLRRRGFSERQVIARLGMQMPQARKISLADYVIDNSGTIEATRKQAQTLLEQILRGKSQRKDERQIQ